MNKSLYYNILLLFLFLFCVSLSKTTAQSLQLISKRFFVSDNIQCDPMGNLYIIHENSLTQYDSNFRELRTFSTNAHSKIQSIDVSNPFKILVFIKDFSTLQILDNTLSPSIAEIKITDLGIQQPELLCSSHENCFWVFNVSDFQIYRYNYQLQRLNTTGDLSSNINTRELPLKMMEFENQLFVLFPQTGIVVFDAFGTYYKTIPLINVVDFQVVSNYLFTLKSNKLNAYKIKTIEQADYILNEANVSKFCLLTNRLFALSNDSLSVYLIK